MVDASQSPRKVDDGDFTFGKLLQVRGKRRRDGRVASAKGVNAKKLVGAGLERQGEG